MKWVCGLVNGDEGMCKTRFYIRNYVLSCSALLHVIFEKHDFKYFWFTEYPRGISEDETFITEEEAAELIKQGWIQKYE